LARLHLWPSLRKLLSSVAISAIVGVITALAALIVSYLLFPVTGIEVRGARMFPESEVWKAVPNHASLLFLNTEALETGIESNPWVKGAKVIKDWESGIVTVEVEERRAVLNADLGDRRVVLAADGMELPELGGADLERVGLDEVQLEEILRVSEMLEENGMVLDSVDGVGAGGVDTTVEGRRTLFARDVGENQARALTQFVEEYPEASYFDLRSPNRVVVGVESGARSGSSDG
jgi:POTRA domain, FtsQ-type